MKNAKPLAKIGYIVKTSRGTRKIMATDSGMAALEALNATEQPKNIAYDLGVEFVSRLPDGWERWGMCVAAGVPPTVDVREASE